MLLAIMYHGVGSGKHANTLKCLRSHFHELNQTYPIVLPGDPLQKGKLSICLTFDDATFDFYHYIFPLLKEFKIRALLAVPVRYILESTDLSPEERLSVPYTLAMQDGFFDTKAPFCTWKELNEMVESGLVEIASHSFMHCNLTFKFVDLEQEVVRSKEILEAKLPQAISSFIYPFGKTTPAVHEYISNHYPYAFRIGSQLNWGWGNGKKPLSRVIGDNMFSPASLTSFLQLTKYFCKALIS
ncbi:MAG: polysaccharide deacetylase family protein [Chlamydiales bacterium]